MPGASAKSLLGVLLLSVLLASCGGGGGGSSPDTNGEGRDSSPRFSGLIAVIASNSEEASLRWLAASDDTTAADAITYDVHVSEFPDFVPSEVTRRLSLVGETEALVPGLIGGATYYFAVIARDEDGNASAAPSVKSLTLPAMEAVLDSHQEVVFMDQAGLGVPVIEGSQFRFSADPAAEFPAVGSIIVGSTSDGGYLRRVVSVARADDEIIVETDDAALSDAITSGAVSATLTLGEGESRTDPASAGRNVRLSRHSTARPSDGVYYDPIANAYHIGPAPVSARGARVEGSVGDSLSATVSLSLEPTITTYLDWTGGGVRGGELIVSGTAVLTSDVRYEFTGAAEYVQDATLFERRMSVQYVIAGMPVFQDIILTVRAELTASASSAVTAGATASHSLPFRFGVRYDPAANEWKAIAENSDSESQLTADLSVNGAVDGEVRLIPTITNRFYRVVAGSFSFEPVLQGSIRADSTGLPPGVPVALKQFDIDFFAECHVQAHLNIFVKVPIYPRSQVCATQRIPLFSLPEVEIAVGSRADDGSFPLTATITDGAHNPLDRASIRWDAEFGGSFSANAADTRFYPGFAGISNVYFSAVSALGEAGRTYFSAEVSPCDLASVAGTYTRSFDLGDHSRETYVVTGNTISGTRSRWIDAEQGTPSRIDMSISGTLTFNHQCLAMTSGTATYSFEGRSYTLPFTGAIEYGDRFWWEASPSSPYTYGNIGGLACKQSACD